MKESKKIIELTPQQVHTGFLIVVGQGTPFTSNPSALVPVTADASSILLEKRAAALLNSLMQQINGWQEIVPVSAWRSIQEQTILYKQSVAEHGEAFTKRYVAAPGESEHHTGLAIDLGTPIDGAIDFIRPAFPDTGLCQVFRKLAPWFGFIERYPKEKQFITHIDYEPWHFRYVGIPHAAIITQNRFTLEEYMEFLKNDARNKPFIYNTHLHETILISYIPASKNQNTKIVVRTDKPYIISGNNIDGFVLTEWRNTHDALHR
ncbi:MAG: M15 family metallopeptidase [Clostridiales bacterium]|nr:M15 family metallopeptidase [Clostridiales bacterium]